MKVDYKNWVPNGMIKGFGAAAMGLAGAAIGAGLLGKNTASTVVSAVLGVGAVGCGAFAGWCVYANGLMSPSEAKLLMLRKVRGGMAHEQKI